METAIKLTGVSFAYEDGADVLRGITFTVSRGDFLCVVGDNGCGKSTLLKLLMGTLRPTRGEVWREGAGRAAYIGQHAGHVNRDFPATALEVAALGAYGKRGKAAKQAARAALGRVGMEDRGAAQIGKLSGGQRQRVLIAKALAGEPDTLILDEPTVGVDFGSVGSICCLLGELNRAGITVVMVTHDMPSIIAHATRILDFKHTGGVEMIGAGEYARTFEH